MGWAMKLTKAAMDGTRPRNAETVFHKEYVVFIFFGFPASFTDKRSW
jgi:hypothetical protein